MAKSFLAAQLQEVRGSLKGVKEDLAALSSIRDEILGAGVSGAPGGGGQFSSPGSVAPSGGPSTIAEFLAGRDGGGASRSSTKGGAEAGLGLVGAERPADETEKSIMASLGESLEYVRKLMNAAKWARLPPAEVLRAPKEERDALIAAWEEATAGLSARSTEGQIREGSRNIEEKYGTRVFIGGNGGGLSGGGNIGGGGAPLGPGGYAPGSLGPGGTPTGGALGPGGGSFGLGAQAGPTEGDRQVVSAVDGVAKAIEGLSRKIDGNGGLGFRMRGVA